MAFGRTRNAAYVFPSSTTLGSAWPSSGDTEHRYASVSAPYNDRDTQGRNSNYSVVSDFIPLEQDITYSSRTAILDTHHPRTGQGPEYVHGQLGNAWQPGFWAQLPWSGVLALLFATLATFACVAVLVVSNGIPIDEWHGFFQPTVYLSIASAVANIALTYALYQGVIISFWRKATGGAALRDLHLYWHSGSSLWGAFEGIARFRGKITSLACIMTFISILRGPLMQRAASVRNIIAHQEGNLSVHSALELPWGYAGRDSGRTSTPSFMNPNFTDIVQAYTQGDDIVGVYAGCNSTCYTSIRGFGFGVECNVTGVPYSLAPETVNSNGEIIPAINVYSADAWAIQTFGHGSATEGGSTGYSTNHALLLNTTLIANATHSYNGSMLQHLCALRAGIVSYPTIISNNTITLQSNSWRNDTFLADRGFRPLPYNSHSNLAGFILAAKGLYEGTASYQFGGGAGWILNLNGASANRYFQRTSPSGNYYYLDTNITWRDPMEDMINSMREIAFRTSLQIAADNTSYPNASQIVPFIGETPKTVYTTNYNYMAGAVLVSFLGVIFVIPTFHGFWELGRPVSFSPLEIAKAFNAPLLQGVQGNGHVNDLLNEVGAMKVRYGDSGTTVSTTAYGDEVRKIEIGPATGIRPPEKGVRYI
ncbi:hypothetical protein H2198_001641 [Neophaeococcomyces mojaviensis]|uniref:Uncharacterized protein n=1 Tax=Neophaeococcomyces mojaviensis TaxID=3383035 RepID=A0ACC3AGB8_9EURO|nr:hypothetical protein H2198_001641 [Knufia sp. JES_112]